MDPRSAADVAVIVNGDLSHGSDQWVGPDVVVDSREITPGALFVALPGERVDGHDFVTAAQQAGAGAALVARTCDTTLPQIVVADPAEGLSALATNIVAHKRDLVVVGVTGSAGKTSTKDLIAQLLETEGPTIAPPGSFNNEIGAPLTACRVDRDTRFLVMEMGARGIGHVAALTQITPPTIGVVVNVGSAHVGEFGSTEAIVEAKGELVEALPSTGWAVLNADDPRVLGMAARTSARLALFSAQGDPGQAPLRLWASDLNSDALGRHSVTIHVARAGQAEESARVTLRLIGSYQVMNALAAATAAVAAGLPLARAATTLSRAEPRSRWRMEVTERADGLVIVNDAYNANPEAMEVALGTLAQLRRGSGRLVAVLGDMLELGESSLAEHRRMGQVAAGLGIDVVLATGGFGSQIIEGFGASNRQGRYFETWGELARYVDSEFGADDVVLIKASRGLGLERVAQVLTDAEGADS